MVSLAVSAVSVLAVIVLLGVSALFSSSEIAIFSLPDSWIDQQTATDDRRMATLRKRLADSHRLLVTLLVGTNVVNIAISSILAVLVASYLDPGVAVVVTTVVTSLVILVFGEIVPKTFGLDTQYARFLPVIATPANGDHRYETRVLSMRTRSRGR
jgi:Mg2+/Co2+ transporter CorB